MKKNKCVDCCPAKPLLKERPPMSERQAARLESTFKILANGTRLRLLHVLVRAAEMCVGDIAEALGMRPQAISNQLQRLSDQSIVEVRREGLQMFYRVVDPCVISLLDRGWCLAEDAAQRISQAAREERAAS
jgi:DNA-binding transcriptional ArsR family regulator